MKIQLNKTPRLDILILLEYNHYWTSFFNDFHLYLIIFFCFKATKSSLGNIKYVLYINILTVCQQEYLYHVFI